MQAKDVDGIGASRQGSPPLVSCAVTRDQLHRQGPWARAACTTDGGPAPRQSRKMSRATPGRPPVRAAPGRRSATVCDAEKEEGTVVSRKWSPGTMHGRVRIIRRPTPITIRRQSPVSKLIYGLAAGQGEAEWFG